MARCVPIPATVPVGKSTAPSPPDHVGPPVADVSAEQTSPDLANGLSGFLEGIGDATLFALRGMSGAVRRVGWHDQLPVSYAVGVGSAPVVAIGGLVVGMILAVQAHGQYHAYALETHLGAMIVNAVVRELGPLLAAIWLVTRVGSAMTADLAAMRTTKQIDALAGRGVDPVARRWSPRGCWPAC